MKRTWVVATAVALGIGVGAMLSVSPTYASPFSGTGPSTVTVGNTVATDTRIVGQSVDVSVTGTVALDSASLETLNEPICPPLSMGHIGIDGEVRLVPTSAAASRTRLLVVSHGTAGFLSCRTGPAVGFAAPMCTIPDAAVVAEGALVFPGASLTLDIDSSTLLRCLNCAMGGAPAGATVTASYIELSCL